MLDEIVRRNRRRAIAMVALAAANAWLLLSILAFVAILLSSRHVDVAPMAAVAVALGAPAAALILSPMLWARRRTLGLLGTVEPGPGELRREKNLLAELAIAVGTPPVGLALLVDDAPNALAVGLRPARTTIVVTTGLAERLTRDELEAVLAAELCMVRRRDVAVRTVAVGATSFTGTAYRMFRTDTEPGHPWYSRLDWSAWALVVLTWPTMVAGHAIRRWVLRSFDFAADEMALAVTRNPDGLISALRKLRDDRSVVMDGLLASQTAPLWFEPLPEDDVDPYHETARFRFAPTLDERLARLEALTQTARTD